MTNEPLLKTVHLKKYFKVSDGQLHAVDDVSLEIDKGRTLGIVCESGCGKSTLGRAILSLSDATDGQVFFHGQDILRANQREMRQIRRKMQIVFQDPYSSLNPRMSVFQLIAEPLIRNKIYSSKRELEKRVFQLMETAGLTARYVDAYPHELDGGRRQRIGIARALSLEPEFIVCDEPVSALDVSIQAQILNLLMDLQKELGLTYLFITHNLAVVKHISDDVAVMYLGQCVERASSRELFRNPLHPYTKALLAAIPEPKLSAKKEFSLLKGELSNPVNPEPGCRFAPRCPYCTEACRGQDLEPKEYSPNHVVACRLY